MIDVQTLRIIDYAVLSCTGVCVALCLAAAAYAVPWTQAMREARASRQFNRLWQPRTAMQLAASLWLVWELLRMLALWGVRSRPGLASNRTSEQLCRIYLGLGLGLLQPFFMLLALLLCQSTLSAGKRRRQEGRTAAGILGLAALGTAPLAAVQVVLAWFSQIFKSHNWEERVGSLPRYFFGVYYQGSADQCASNSAGCIVCVYPAAMVIVLGLFCLAFVLGLGIVSARLAAATINRRLLWRMRCLEVGMGALVVGHLALLGASISTNPFNLVWQILIILYSITKMAMALLVTWLLVIVPVYVAKSADKLVPPGWQAELDEDDVEAFADGGGVPPQELSLLVKRAGALSTDSVRSDASGSERSEGSEAGGGGNSSARSGGGSSVGNNSQRSLLPMGARKSSGQLPAVPPGRSQHRRSASAGRAPW